MLGEGHPADCGATQRLGREKRTVAAMIRLYCRDHHRPDEVLCGQCEELRQYAICRLDRCPFGVEKPVCSKCPIHCYRPAMREQIRTVMAYAGPRMPLRHPVLAVGHIFDSLRPAPGHPTPPGSDDGHASENRDSSEA